MVLGIFKKFNFNKNNKKSAGLALEDNILRYIEIERRNNGEIKILRELSCPLNAECVVNDDILKPELLHDAFKFLVKNSAEPVVLGLPSRNAVIKNINYPDMALNDARSALAFELDDYFPELKKYLSYGNYKLGPENIVYDIANFKSQKNSRFIAAAANINIINNILNIAERTGLHVKAIEPASAILLRLEEFINLNFTSGYEAALALALRDFL